MVFGEIVVERFLETSGTWASTRISQEGHSPESSITKALKEAPPFQKDAVMKNSQFCLTGKAPRDILGEMLKLKL